MKYKYMMVYCFQKEEFSFDILSKSLRLIIGNCCFKTKININDFTWEDYKDLMNKIKKTNGLKEEDSLTILNIIPMAFSKGELDEDEKNNQE